MSERRPRAFLRHAALPATIFLLSTIALWLLWRQSHPTDMPVADRRLHELYSLEPGEVLRLLPPPGIPERARYNIAARFGQLQNPSFFLHWDGRATRTSYAVRGFPLEAVLYVIGIKREELDIDPTLNLRIPGDLIVRSPAPLDEKINALETLLKSVTGRTIRVERRPSRESEVIVVRGAFAHEALNFTDAKAPTIHLYSGSTSDRWSGRGYGRVSGLLEAVSRLANRPVLDRSTSPRDALIFWSLHVKQGELDEDDEALEQFLDNLSAQTSLTFTREKRTSEAYFVREEK